METYVKIVLVLNALLPNILAATLPYNRLNNEATIDQLNRLDAYIMQHDEFAQHMLSDTNMSELKAADLVLPHGDPTKSDRFLNTLSRTNETDLADFDSPYHDSSPIGQSSSVEMGSNNDKIRSSAFRLENFPEKYELKKRNEVEILKKFRELQRKNKSRSLNYEVFKALYKQLINA